MKTLDDIDSIFLEKYTVEKLETFTQKMSRYPGPLGYWVGVTDERYNSYHEICHEDVCRTCADELIVC
jgi:hypothetical protein